MDYLGELDEATLNALNDLNACDETIAPLTSSPAVRGPKRASHARRQPLYLLRLDGYLSSQQITSIVGFLPPIETGTSEDGTADFCRLEQSNLDKVEAWITLNYPSYRCTKVRLAIAHKDACLPTLGIDPTLPQHRPNRPIDLGALTQYPIWYFFYGTLASPEFLAHVLELPDGAERPTLIPAIVLDGAFKTWANKYRALVDAPGSEVGGWAYMVTSSKHEEALRTFEGYNYEVVKATIRFGEDAGELQGLVEGCTFRFAGYEDELDC